MLKKLLCLIGVISVLCVIYVKEGFCAAYEGPGVGVRPLTMGGAFVGLADDWSAVIWNPAGLTQLKNKGFGFSLDYVPVEGSDGNSVANPMINNIKPEQGDVFFQFTGAEPTSFNKTDVKSTVYLPTVAGYTQYNGFTIGGAIYVPMGYASDWEDSKGVVKEATYKVDSYEKIMALTAAKKITSNLSLGLGVNFLTWSLEQKATKVVTAPVPYTYNLDMSGDGSNFEGVVGLHYAFPNKKCSVGFVYRSGSKISVKGDAQMSYPLPPNWGISKEEADFNLKQQCPTTYALGIAYKAVTNLVFTGDLNRTDWSKQRKEVTFSQQGKFLNDKDESLGWKDANKVRLGAEYTLNEAWKLRAGFFTDPSPVPDEAVSLTNLIDMDRKWSSLGAGYTNGDWQVDMGIQHNEGKRTVQWVDYEKKCTSVHIAASRQF